MAREFPSDVAFTPSVKRLQHERGSRAAYARMEAGHGWSTTITPELAAFVATLDMFYLFMSSEIWLRAIQYGH